MSVLASIRARTAETSLEVSEGSTTPLRMLANDGAWAGVVLTFTSNIGMENMVPETHRETYGVGVGRQCVRNQPGHFKHGEFE